MIARLTLSSFVLVVEVKKQSSCAVQLTNISDQYVAFKVEYFNSIMEVNSEFLCFFSLPHSSLKSICLTYVCFGNRIFESL